MYIYLRGAAARWVLLALAVGGFILALGDVLDVYDALWKFTVPATLVYAALIWIFALSPAKGEAPPQAAWPLGLDIILGKTFMTAVLLVVTLGAVALVYDVYLLIINNWHYIVLAIGLLVVIFVWAWLAELARGKKRRASQGVTGPPEL